jgi:hypothetical protein
MNMRLESTQKESQQGLDLDEDGGDGAEEKAGPAGKIQ